MLVDLHAHFPMHLLPDEQRRTHHRVKAWARRRWQARFVNLVSLLFNYQGPGDAPSVTEALMRDGNVGVVLSVLYTPLDEMDLSQPYGAPPLGSYFQDVEAQLDLVESKVAENGHQAVIAHSPHELDELLGGDLPVLIHCIEGGFQLGHAEDEVTRNVRRLAERGVAYVTVAHLFWREVATSAPALPFLPDSVYDFAFPQPETGLSDRGRAAVRAMVGAGILVDVTHMRQRALEDTFDLLDELDDKRRTIPLVATHMACRFGRLHYCLTDSAIERIAARGGVMGCILCEHYITNGLPGKATDFDSSVAAVCRHIDRIREVTGSFDHIAIGSDLDGYIKPALKGLEHMGHMRRFQEALALRYGPEDAARICSGNALRVLRSAWRHEHLVS